MTWARGVEEQEEEERKGGWRRGRHPKSFGSNLCPHWSGSRARTVMFYPHVCKLSCLLLPQLNPSLCSYAAWDRQRIVSSLSLNNINSCLYTALIRPAVTLQTLQTITAAPSKQDSSDSPIGPLCLGSRFTGDPTVNSVYLRLTPLVSSDPRRGLHMRHGSRNAQLSLPLWSSVNRACLITSIGFSDNVGIKVEKGATMWHIRAAGFKGTDLAQSGSLIRRPFEPWLTWKLLWSALWWGRDSNAGVTCWDGHMDYRYIEKYKRVLLPPPPPHPNHHPPWHWSKYFAEDRHTRGIVMTCWSHDVNSPSVFLQVFDMSVKSGEGHKLCSRSAQAIITQCSHKNSR